MKRLMASIAIGVLLAGGATVVSSLPAQADKPSCAAEGLQPAPSTAVPAAFGLNCDHNTSHNAVWIEANCVWPLGGTSSPRRRAPFDNAYFYTGPCPTGASSYRWYWN